MILRIRTLIVFFFMCLSLSTIGQTKSGVEKNNITYDYTFYQGERSTGGEVLAQGIVIGYSRYFTKRIYGDITLGLMHFEGKNNRFFLSPEDMNFLNMRTFTLGAGYDLYQSTRFVLSAELAYLRQTNEMLLVDELDLRSTGVSDDSSLRYRLKSRYFLTNNLQILLSYSHGFELGKYKSEWLSLGLGYNF